MTDDKVRENRVRRLAERQGLRLEKSRRRDPLAYDFGTYALIDARTKAIVAGDKNQGYGLTIEDVENALQVDPQGADSWREFAEVAPDQFKRTEDCSAEELRAAADRLRQDAWQLLQDARVFERRAHEFEQI